MNNIYQLTSEIRRELNRIQKIKGIKIVVKGDYYIAKPIKGIGIDKSEEEFEVVSEDYIWYKEEEYSYEWKKILAIQEPQIKDILIALEEILGESIIYEHYLKAVIDAPFPYFTPPKTRSETLYQNWCCGWPKSRFETEHEKVLSELLEILKGIK